LTLFNAFANLGIKTRQARGKNSEAKINNRKQKVQLTYPCLWIYKVFGTDQDQMRNAIYDLIQDRSCRISLSRESETAKYVSLNVELTVESESHRTALYEALKAHHAVKLVL